MSRLPTFGPRSRAVTLLLLVALMPAAALVPGAAAQGQFVAEGWPRADGRLLADLVHEEDVFTDPTGDTTMFLGTGTPENDMEASADITRLSIGETADHLLVSLAHRGYDDTTYGAKDALLGQYGCTIGLAVAADRAIDWEIRFDNWGLGAGGALYGNLWRYETEDEEEEDEDDDGSFSYRERDHIESFPVLLVDDHLEFVLAKEWIRIGARERLLTTEDTLRDITVACEYSPTIFTGWEDEVSRETAESGSGRYKIQVASGSERFGLDVVEDLRERRVFTAAPGQPQKIPLLIENKLDRKILVNLTVDLDDGAGGALEGWKAVLTPTVEVRSNNSTQATLIVTPPPDAAHRDRAHVQIIGRLLGHEDEVRLGRSVLANVAPSPERATLHFHNAPFEARYFCIVAACASDVMDIGTGDVFLMNVLADDPDHTDEARDASAVRFAGGGAYAFLDLPLSRGLRLDPEGTLDLTVTLETDIPHDVQIHADLYTTDGETDIGDTTQRISLEPGKNEHTFRIIPREEALSLPAGTGLVLSLRADLEAVFRFGGMGPGLSWHADGSTLTFPLLPLAEPEVELTDGRALPTIHFRNGSEAEEYVNPGKSRVYELALVNEGVEKDILEVRPDPDQDDWQVQVRPGTRFELDPGRSAPFSVVVTPPEDAEEGEILKLNLTAKSANDDKVRSTIMLKTIVTTGVEIEGEEYDEPAEEERVDPYVGKTEESPMAAMAWVLLGAVLMLGSVRRRPGQP